MRDHGRGHSLVSGWAELIADPNEGRLHFRDVLAVAVIQRLKTLLAPAGMDDLRAWLQLHYADESWADVVVHVHDGAAIVSQDREGLAAHGSCPGSTLLVGDLAWELSRSLFTRRHPRGPADYGRIVRGGPRVMSNRWILAGTRIPVTAIWSFHSAGYSIDEIIGQYPRLTVEDVRAVIAFVGSKRYRKPLRKAAS